jgi:hypothetical protein
VSAGAVPARRCLAVADRGRYRLPGESKKLEAREITVKLSPVFADLLPHMAKLARVAGREPGMDESRYAAEAVEVFLIDAFRDVTGLTPGEYEQRRIAGEVFDWRPVYEDGEIVRWVFVSITPAQGVIQ